MLIENLLVHFTTQNNYKAHRGLDQLKDESIIFIQDSKEIATHGTVYKSVNWSILEDNTVYVPDSIPYGVSIVDGFGNIVTINNYNVNKGITGLLISDGTHKIVMAVDGYGSEDDVSMGVDFNRYSVKTGKFGTYQSMTDTTLINLPRYATLEEAITDFNTVGNTDAYIQALQKSAKPSEVIAAVAASSYSAGIYEEGAWDLPAAGHMKMVDDNRDTIINMLTNLSNKGLSCMGLVKIFQTYDLWTSTICDEGAVWIYHPETSTFSHMAFLSNRMVLPIHVIE